MKDKGTKCTTVVVERRDAAGSETINKVDTKFSH